MQLGQLGHLGYFTHVASDVRPSAAYRQTIELAVAAETLGFSSFWIAQHHGNASAGWSPSPLVLLAAVAEHTSTIGLGTAVIAAPLEDSRRLAEDAATLDVLSEGRLQLGVGAGSDDVASDVFGHDFRARHAECLDVVDQLHGLLSGDDLVPPAPGLHQRMWWATGTPAAVDAAAARGIGLISGRPADAAGSTVVDDLTRYWTRAVEEPRVVLSRFAAWDTPAKELVHRWTNDPAMPWASGLIVQAQPTDCRIDRHLELMRMLADDVAPALDLAMASRRHRSDLASV
ncbi:LLM class flavin-dependent oxidoreductase [Pseudonocardia spinosispora]|uniref:LLM class flavin-dependent oxidoreductase n=1 Tax=Pseudonocardia spinosispora TaxID=103441 RepID=UPI0009FE7DC2|nr:LLM class flavin-dependent oxidoreductase [Pseudonocardia spinosispora]